MKQPKYRLLIDVNKLIAVMVLLSFVSCNNSSKLSKFNTASYYLPNHKQNLVSINYQSSSDSLQRINFFIDKNAAIEEYENTLAKVELYLYNSFNERKAIYQIEKGIEFLAINEFIGSIELPQKLLPNQKVYYTIQAAFLKDKFKGIYIHSENKFENAFATENDSIVNLEEVKNWQFQKYISEPALVPFTEEEETWNFNYELIPINKKEIFNKVGYYVNEKEGIYFALNDYPSISKPDELVAPLRYITTNEEYKSLKTAQITKLQIDTFWYEMAGNFERARILIKEYYQRVSFANQYFTSYKEGWMTDRGMIYIIYGPPDEVFQHDDVEIWYHANSDTKFIFDKINIPGNKHHFVLQRNIDLKNSWHNAVNNWRNGQLKSTF